MITIENLCKAYNDKILFKNFHLEIPDSSFLVISGESGCGKSTLLNICLLYTSPSPRDA